MPTRIRLQFRPIDKIVFQPTTSFLYEKIQQAGKYCLKNRLQRSATKIVNRPKIRMLARRQPHEMNILSECLSYSTAGIQLDAVPVNQHLEHHPWVVAAGSATFVPLFQNLEINPIDKPINHPHQMVGTDQLLQAWRK